MPSKKLLNANIDTGIAKLDADLLTLFELERGDQLSKLTKPLLKKNVELKDFKHIPDGILLLISVINNDKAVATLVKKVNPEQHNILESAKALVQNKLSIVSEHPLFLDAVKKAKEARREGLAKDPVRSLLSSLRSISVLPLLAGTPPRLVPQNRILLERASNQPIIDLTLTIDECFFLFSVLSKALRDQLKGINRLMDLEQLDGATSMAKMSSQIKGIQTVLNEMDSLTSSAKGKS